jgi:hypothetical protein
MNGFRLFITLPFLLGIMFASPSWAGSQQEGEPQYTVEELAILSKKVEKTLAAKGARVFIIARSGRPAKDLPKGVTYTHVAFGVYSNIQTADGRTIPGYAFYNLYQDAEDGSKSKLVTDFTVDFLSSVHNAKVGIIIPNPALQKRLLSFIGTAEYQALHNPEYSVLANPNNTTFQNCTEYVLDVINAAIYQTVNQDKLKQIAKEHFKAQDINLSPFTMLLGSMFVPGVTTKDHVGQIRTATFTTIANYFEQFNLAEGVLNIEL